MTSTFYIYVILYNLFLYNSQKNISVTLTPPADFALVNLSMDGNGTVKTSEFVTIRWTVTNRGPNSPYARYWYDKVVSRPRLNMASKQ